ncbi:GNAT family N-acetyltransferase [Microbacteriaceae bacterium VKM Ac-2855]|nr:GNAT family N-acetyltransferase [Microbacteriaceae bacterium VKM Ac-2855]
MISDRHVLLAEIDGIHVGFCVSFPGPESSDPLYIQVVGVVPEAQRRGVGLALLTAAAEHEPRPNIVLATQNENLGARALNARFAKSIGASIARVPLSGYRHNDLGIPRGAGYHAWLIQRAPAS